MFTALLTVQLIRDSQFIPMLKCDVATLLMCHSVLFKQIASVCGLNSTHILVLFCLFSEPLNYKKISTIGFAINTKITTIINY